MATAGIATRGSLDFELVRPLVALQPRLRAFLAGVRKSAASSTAAAADQSSTGNSESALEYQHVARKRRRVDSNAEAVDETRHAARLYALLESARARLAVAESTRSEVSAQCAQDVAEAEAAARDASAALADATRRESESRTRLSEAQGRISELEARVRYLYQSSERVGPSIDVGAGVDWDDLSTTNAHKQQLVQLENVLEQQAYRAKEREQALQLELYTALQEAAQASSLRRQLHAAQEASKLARRPAVDSESQGPGVPASESPGYAGVDTLWRYAGQLRQELRDTKARLRESERRVAGLKANRENETMLAERAGYAEAAAKRSEERVQGLVSELAQAGGVLADAKEEADRLMEAVGELAAREGLNLSLRSSPRKSALSFPDDAHSSSSSVASSSSDASSSLSSRLPMQHLASLIDAAKDARAALTSMSALRADAQLALAQVKEGCAGVEEQLRLAQSARDSAQAQQAATESSLSECKRQLELQNRKIDRQQREINGLYDLLKSYDDEDDAAAKQVQALSYSASMSDSPSAGGMQHIQSPGQLPVFLSPRSKSTAARVSMLQDQLEESKRECERLQGQLRDALPADQAAVIRAELEAARRARKVAEAEAAQLRGASKPSTSVASRRADVDREPASGLVPMPNTRIVHMRQNPLKQAIRQRMKDDKEARQAAATASSSSAAASAGETGEAAAASELDGSILYTVQGAQAVSTMAEAQKLRERLVSQFQQRMQKFREIMYRVLGWKVWMEESGTVGAFQSVYAADANDVVRFGIKTASEQEGGAAAGLVVELLNTKYVRELDDDLLQLVHRYGSLPAFMANLLGTQFSQSTTGM